MNFRFFHLKSIFVLALLASFAWSLEAHAASLRLNWTDASHNETGFKVERMTGNGRSYVQIATVPANTKTYIDTTASSGTTYCYRVKAFNSAGNSSPSNAGCETARKSSGSSNNSSGNGSSGSNGSSSNGNPIPIARLSSKWNDYRVTMKIQSPDNDRVGVMFRYQDNDNYYRFSWASGSRRLEKRLDGAFKMLAHDSAAYRMGQTYTLQIIAKGSALKVLIDGKTIFSVTDSSFSDGTVALYSHFNAGSRFDDVLVEELPSGKVLLSDNFNDHDHVGWTIVDEGDQGGPSDWSAASGAFVQDGNISGTYALFTRGSWQDYRFALTMRSADDDRLGIMFRFQDSDNYYSFSWGRESAGRKLIKREKGADKIIAQDSVPYVAGKSYNVEIVAQGSSLKVIVDGKSVFSVKDQTFTAGTIGLYTSWNKGSAFDNVLVEELPTKAVLLWDDFNNGNFAGWNIFDQSGGNASPSAWAVTNGQLMQNNNTISFLLY